jgi:Zn-dependent M28 family amino/carboxypeptidase
MDPAYSPTATSPPLSDHTAFLDGSVPSVILTEGAPAGSPKQGLKVPSLGLPYALSGNHYVNLGMVSYEPNKMKHTKFKKNS